MSALLRLAALLAVFAPAALLFAGCGGSGDASEDSAAGTSDTSYADDMAREHAGDRPTASPAANH